MQKTPRLRPALLKFLLRQIVAFRTGQGRLSVYEEMVLGLELVKNSRMLNANQINLTFQSTKI